MTTRITRDIDPATIEEVARCEWCNEEFERLASRGPAPKYCSDAHRQAAHRQRRQSDRGAVRGEPAKPEDLGVLVLRHRNRIIEIASGRGASNVRLFGSVARGEATRDSDVDLLVDLDPSVGLVGLAGLERELSTLLGRAVDVVPAANLKNGLMARVEDEAIAL